MKKNKILIGIVLIIVISLIIAIFIYNNKNSNNKNTNLENNSNVTTSRISTNINEEQAKNRVTNILQNQNEIMQNSYKEKETEISSYSTTIKDKSAGRLTNIGITCSTLNNTIIRNGQTFSFNETVGKPTVERGYQEATVIINKKTEKGIGRRKLPSK